MRTADNLDRQVATLLNALDRVAQAHEQEAAAVRRTRAAIADAAAEARPLIVSGHVTDTLLGSLNNANRIGAIHTAIATAHKIEEGL